MRKCLKTRCGRNTDECTCFQPTKQRKYGRSYKTPLKHSLGLCQIRPDGVFSTLLEYDHILRGDCRCFAECFGAPLYMSLF